MLVMCFRPAFHTARLLPIMVAELQAVRISPGAYVGAAAGESRRRKEPSASRLHRYRNPWHGHLARIIDGEVLR